MARIYVWEYVNKRPLYLFSLAWRGIRTKWGVWWGRCLVWFGLLSFRSVKGEVFGTRGAYKLLKCRCKYLTAWCCQFKLKPLPQKLRNQMEATPIDSAPVPITETHGIKSLGHKWILHKKSMRGLTIKAAGRGIKTFLYDCTLSGPRILESTVYMLMVAGWANWEIKKLPAKDLKMSCH